MPDTQSIVIVKNFGYRGKQEEFSNKYHFEGANVDTPAEWENLTDAFLTLERPTVPASVLWVRAYGYNAGVDHAVWQKDWTSGGTQPGGTMSVADWHLACPGDTAITIRWNTGELNSRGKKIYCRKYIHPAFRDEADWDEVNPQQRAQLQIFAEQLIDGSLGNNIRYCGPQGAGLSEPLVAQYLTTRTLKRRGKRPLP